MGAFLFWECRYGFSAPRRFVFFLIIVEGSDQAGEHCRRSLEERLGLRLRDFPNVLANMTFSRTDPFLSSSSVRMTRTVARLASVELASRGFRFVSRIPHLRPGLDANPVF